MIPVLATAAVITIAGWAAQGLYFLRFLLQWWASEKAGRTIVPRAFWWMSFWGAALALVYAIDQREPVFVASPMVNLFLYARNLMLSRSRRGLPIGQLIAFAAGVVALSVLFLALRLEQELLGKPWAWVLVGITGQALWVARFPLQWWISERRESPVLPPAFFWISLAGSGLLMAYALDVGDPIWIAGMAIGPIVYGRNLILAYRARAEAPSTGSHPPPGPVVD